MRSAPDSVSRPALEEVATTVAGRAAVASFPPVIPQNPYQSLLYEQLGRLGMPLAPPSKLRLSWLWAMRREVGALHVHWPQSLYRYEGSLPCKTGLAWARVALFGLRLSVARALGYRIVWTVHQPIPHEAEDPRRDRVAAKALALHAHALVAHDELTARRIGSELGCDPQKVFIVPHGSYTGVYPRGRSREAVRRELGIPRQAKVFLAFGHVRGYKDVGLLLSAFAEVTDSDLVLVVAGRVIDPQAGQAVLSAAAVDSRIRPMLEYVPDGSVAELFGASDAAVFARGDGGTSGALVLACSLGTPTLVAAIDTYEALVEGTCHWTFRPGDQHSLAAAFESAARDLSTTAEPHTSDEGRDSPSWPEIARRTAAILRGDRMGRADVVLACSAGGHLLQLLALEGAWSGLSRVWVTDDTSDARSLLVGERLVFAHGPTHRNVLALVRNVWLAWCVLHRVRPRVILSTGAAIAVPFAWVGRLRGIKVVYVESLTRIERPSLACRLVAPAANRLYVQWPELAARVHGAIYAGSVVSS